MATIERSAGGAPWDHMSLEALVETKPMPMNFTRTFLLLMLLTLILVSMGAAVGGTHGMVVAFVIALGMNLFALWKSDRMVLRMQGATEVDAAGPTYGWFPPLVHALAARAQLPPPRVYIMQSPQPNAFATGRGPSHAAVCASTGLLDMLSREEVAGVMAHELAHVKNHDTLTMSVAATIGGAISMFAQYLQIGALFGRGVGGRLGGLFAMLVAPIAAGMVQMAISRSREYQADRLGAMICGHPLWLASALARIQDAVNHIRHAPAETNPATAHLLIVNPFSGRQLRTLFATHPSTDDRIAELRKLAVEMATAGAGPQIAGIDMDVNGARARSGPWG